MLTGNLVPVKVHTSKQQTTNNKQPEIQMSISAKEYMYAAIIVVCFILIGVIAWTQVMYVPSRCGPMKS
jgi:uncharacterized membrane protein YvbJ